MTMRLFLAVFALAVTALAASAADNAASGAAPLQRSQAANRSSALPFPRGERTQRVWDSGACWSECGAQCAWGHNACLAADEQGRCLAWADACDRYCQRQCRTDAGPLLPID